MKKWVIFSVVCSVVLIVLAIPAVVWGIQWLQGGGLGHGQAQSVGIIGGADGPTAVYVSSAPVSVLLFIWGAGCFAALAGLVLGIVMMVRDTKRHHI